MLITCIRSKMKRTQKFKISKRISCFERYGFGQTQLNPSLSSTQLELWLRYPLKLILLLLLFFYHGSTTWIQPQKLKFGMQAQFMKIISSKGFWMIWMVWFWFGLFFPQPYSYLSHFKSYFDAVTQRVDYNNILLWNL